MKQLQEGGVEGNVCQAEVGEVSGQRPFSFSGSCVLPLLFSPLKACPSPVTLQALPLQEAKWSPDKLFRGLSLVEHPSLTWVPSLAGLVEDLGAVEPSIASLATVEPVSSDNGFPLTASAKVQGLAWTNALGRAATEVGVSWKDSLSYPAAQRRTLHGFKWGEGEETPIS